MPPCAKKERGEKKKLHHGPWMQLGICQAGVKGAQKNPPMQRAHEQTNPSTQMHLTPAD